MMGTPQDFTLARVNRAANQFRTEIIKGMHSYVSVRDDANTVLELVLTPVRNTTIPEIPGCILRSNEGTA
jgi:hypothetical protein